MSKMAIPSRCVCNCNQQNDVVDGPVAVLNQPQLMQNAEVLDVNVAAEGGGGQEALLPLLEEARPPPGEHHEIGES